MLRKENISVARTTWPSGINFPTLLIVLHWKWSTKLDQGTTIVDIVNDILCIGWQDNNFVLGLSTIHTVHKASSWVNIKRNCPGQTSINAAITRKVFGDSAFMTIDFPAWINNYNHNMNTVDLANQHRQPYNTQRISYQTWIPLLHWILDQAAINAYKLAVRKTQSETYLNFRRALYTALLDYSQKKRPWTEAGPHCQVDLPKQQICAKCSKREKRRKQLAIYQERAGIEVFKANFKHPTAVSSSCGYCDVLLCKATNCFKE